MIAQRRERYEYEEDQGAFIFITLLWVLPLAWWVFGGINDWLDVAYRNETKSLFIELVIVAGLTTLGITLQRKTHSAHRDAPPYDTDIAKTYVVRDRSSVEPIPPTTAEAEPVEHNDSAERATMKKVVEDEIQRLSAIRPPE